MVLERMIAATQLKNQPDVAMFIGFIFVLVGFITSFLIFVTGMSVAMIGLSSMLMVPYAMKILNLEKSRYRSVFSKENGAVKFYSFLFFGMAFAYTILFGVLNPKTLQIAFKSQLDIIGAPLASSVAGAFATNWSLFYQIISNNLTIIVVLILLSFVYGTGSIFVLNYNASIAGIVYGSILNAFIWGGIPLFAYPWLYLPHTILEILAYLLAAVAGSILSKPLTKRYKSLIYRDFSLLFAAAVLLVILGGYVEVTVPFAFLQ
ncbi:MAG: stage II sporulation protein M [Nanoarchaeota archaeon]|nr:stage II sporulation protein M [Nanoarchaeota archaeon]